MIYDGAAELMRSGGDSWVAFGPADRDGPRHHGHPLWPLDALFGANDDVIEVGSDTIREVSTTHYRQKPPSREPWQATLMPRDRLGG